MHYCFTARRIGGRIDAARAFSLLVAILGLLLVAATTTTTAASRERALEEEEDANGTSSRAQTTTTKPISIFSSGYPVYNTGNLGRAIFVKGLNLPDDCSIEFDPELKDGKRVTVESMEDPEGKRMFKLSLKKGKTWLKDVAEMPFSELFATRVVSARSPSTVLYTPEEKVSVARIYPAPTVDENENLKLPMDKIELVITGHSFNRKATAFKFSPALVAGVDYDYTINAEGTKATLSLRAGKRWRAEPGFLLVTGVSSVPGEIPVSVKVAKVTAALGKENPSSSDSLPVGEDGETEGAVTIELPAHLDKVPTIYRTSRGTPQFSLRGTGFHPSQLLKVVFKDGPLQGEDFDVDVVSATEAVISLKKGASWLESASVPGELILASVNGAPPEVIFKGGDAASSTESGGEAQNEERPVVARVVDTPLVRPSRRRLAFATQTKSITISGTGFSATEPMKIGLLPPGLQQDVDFDLEVRDRETIVLILREGKSWIPSASSSSSSSSSGASSSTGSGGKKNASPNPASASGGGPLLVAWVSVGDGAKVAQGMGDANSASASPPPGGGVRVAMIEKDFTGAVAIVPSSHKIYQTQTHTIYVNVTSLPPKFELSESESGVAVGVEFAAAGGREGDVVDPSEVSASLVVSETSAATLIITLQSPGRSRWARKEDVPLALTALKIPSAQEANKNVIRYPLGKDSGQGVQIAQVVRDVTVAVNKPAPVAFQTFTALLSIRGTGFSFSMHSPLNPIEEVMEDGTGGEDGGEFGETSSSSEEEGGNRVVAVFDPPLIQDEDYMLWVDSTEEITLELLPGRKWRASVPGPLRLVSLDAGAGPVLLEDAIVATIVADNANQLCSNTCAHANDGSCDDDKPVPGDEGAYYCEWGTDCSDCGPRATLTRPVSASTPHADNPLCNNDCGEEFARDGICDDGRPGEWQKHCELGTDCEDCGPLPEGAYRGLPYCSNGVDGSSSAELVPGLKCQFPVTLSNGRTYDGMDGCIRDSAPPGTDFPPSSSGWGWCPVGKDFAKDQKWASCQFCADVLDDPAIQRAKDEAYQEEAELAAERANKAGKKGKTQDKRPSWEDEDEDGLTGAGDGGGFIGRLLRGAAFLALVTASVWAVSRLSQWSKARNGGTPTTMSGGVRYELVNKSA